MQKGRKALLQRSGVPIQSAGDNSVEQRSLLDKNISNVQMSQASLNLRWVLDLQLIRHVTLASGDTSDERNR